jgi:HPr kinase/phosphorylase
MSTRIELHANAVVLGEVGVLIRGPSGAGKSSLSFALIDEAQSRGHYAALVADDRVVLESLHGKLLASGIPGFEGRIESRGEGILRLPHEPATVVGLAVDLVARGSKPPRYPEENAERIELLNVSLQRMDVDLAPGVVHVARMTLRRLGIAPRECPAIVVFA